ncbi:peptide chain release factor N(5)-glutamine methyltransferase [Spartobacteria bacterium LR76]|nr:peptide chain release factor N(5)-glutamine methyltransferase [Spartobacteria bacterium LR76]
MTVLETLTAAADYLGKHSVESPRLNAEHLLAHTLGKKRLDLYLEFDRPLSDADRAPLRELVRQRVQGKPLQHLLGTAEFFGHTFICDGRALIPRPETEQLIEFAMQYPKPARVLDIGTGSGVIAVTFALEFPDAEVFAIDLHSEALSLARENAEKLGAKVHFSQADVLPSEGVPFDLILANLPYIPAGEIPGLQREVQFDPVSALDGGPDGLDIIRRLIVAAPAHLNTGGRIGLEIGHGQAALVCELFSGNNYRDITVRPDYQGIERFVFASYG